MAVATASADVTAGKRSPAVAWPWVAAAVAVMVLAYAPLLVDFFRSLWARTHYQHFPFVLGAFAWLFAARIREGGGAPASRAAVKRRFAGAMALGAWLTLLLAYWVPSPWVGYLSLIVLMAAVVFWVQSQQVIEGLWPTWALLLLVLPLPLNRDQALITKLQRWSSGASSAVLDSLGVLHLMEGNSLQLPDKELFVDEACSGIVSVMSIVACAAIYGVWRRRSIAHILALALAGIGWATVMNTVRISVIAAAYDKYGIDWSAGTAHEILSLCIFMVSFGALVSTDVLLNGLLAPIQPAWHLSHDEPVKWGQWLIRGWDRTVASAGSPLEADEADALEEVEIRAPSSSMWAMMRPTSMMWSVVLAVAFGALPALYAAGAWQHEEFLAGQLLSKEDVQKCIERALACDRETLPAEIGGARQTDFAAHERTREDVMGNFSRTYHYQDAEGREYVVSCDFPYETGWHELTVCYQGVGWTLVNREVLEETTSGNAWERMEADFSKPDGVRAYLCVCAFDETGTPIDLPRMSFWDDLTGALTGRRERARQVAFQVQVWFSRGAEVSDDERAIARQLMTTARDVLRDRIAGGPGVAVDGDTESSVTREESR